MIEHSSLVLFFRRFFQLGSLATPLSNSSPVPISSVLHTTKVVGKNPKLYYFLYSENKELGIPFYGSNVKFAGRGDGMEA